MSWQADGSERHAPSRRGARPSRQPRAWTCRHTRRWQGCLRPSQIHAAHYAGTARHLRAEAQPHQDVELAGALHERVAHRRRHLVTLSQQLLRLRGAEQRRQERWAIGCCAGMQAADGIAGRIGLRCGQAPAGKLPPRPSTRHTQQWGWQQAGPQTWRHSVTAQLAVLGGTRLVLRHHSLQHLIANGGQHALVPVGTQVLRNHKAQPKSRA